MAKVAPPDDFFERHMQDCQAAWEAGVTLALADAIGWCSVYQRPPPAWLAAASLGVIRKLRTPAEVQRHLQDMQHYTRWSTVMELVERKVEFEERGDTRAASWKRMWQAAAEVLAETDARGDWSTIKASYLKVCSDMRNGRAARYFTSTGAGRVPSAPHNTQTR